MPVPIPPDAQVDVVVVNWNAGALLRDCLESLRAHGDGRLASVVVVDNGSTDGSAEIARAVPGVTLVEAGENLGFGTACNRGAKLGQAPLLLFFNPDAQAQPGAIERAVAALAAAPELGVAGIRLVDEHGHAHRHCARYPTWRNFMGNSLGLTRLLPRWFSGLLMNDFDHLSDRRVDHVMGAFYLIRRDLFEAVGGFDERFFVYLEDLDLSRRVTQAGAGIAYLAAPTAFHKQGGTSEKVKAHRLFYALHANLIYAWKHLGPAARLAVVAVTLLVEPVSRSVRALLRLSPQELWDTWRGYGMLYRALPRIFRQMASVDRAG